MADLEITKIELARIRAGQPDPDRGEQPALVDLEVTVANRSQTEMLHLVSEPRKFDYDESTRTLRVDFREPELPANVRVSHLLPPHLDAVGPGETKMLTASIPLKLTNLRPTGRLTGMQMKEIDLAPLERVIVRLDYARRPFRAVPSARPEETVASLREWGTTIEQTVKTKLPSSNPETR